MQAGIAAVFDKARAFVTEIQKLAKAAEAATVQQQEADTGLDSARRRLAEEQADRLLADTADETPHPPPAYFAEAHLAHELALAARLGIKKLRHAKNAEISGITSELEAARDEFNREVTAEFLTAIFQPAAEAFRIMLRHGAALEAALGTRIEELHRVPDVGSWEDDDEKACAVHDKHVEPLKLSQALKRYKGEAEFDEFKRKRDEQMMLAQKPPFDPEGKYRVLHPFTNYGQQFSRGQTVSATDHPPGSLAQLYRAGHLQLITTEQQWEEALEPA